MRTLRTRLHDFLYDATTRRWAYQRLAGLLFQAGLVRFGALYCTYVPDAFFVFRRHPEWNELLARFMRRNRSNNGGDIPRMLAFILNIQQVLDEKIPGDFAELGVWRGNSAAILAAYAGRSARRVFLFDTFTGFTARDLQGIDRVHDRKFFDTSLELVRRTIGAEDQHCTYVKGYFPDSVGEEHRNRHYAVVSLDCDLYEPMRAGLEFFYPLMPRGGIFLLHDYSNLLWAGAKLAVDEFCEARGEFLVLVPDKSGSAFFRKAKDYDSLVDR